MFNEVFTMKIKCQECKKEVLHDELVVKIQKSVGFKKNIYGESSRNYKRLCHYHLTCYENLTKHNSSFIQDLTAEYHCPYCKEAVKFNQLEKWKAKGSPK